MINNNKNISIKSIIIKNEYTLSSIDKKIIKILIKNINNSQYKNNYNFTYPKEFVFNKFLRLELTESKNSHFKLYWLIYYLL